MPQKLYLKWALVLTAAGSLFSGYLSATKFFSGSCAFNEPCPVFIGYPACYFGFAMFLTMFLVTVIALVRQSSSRLPIRANAYISALGILFAGYFVISEIVGWATDGFKSYTLGLSTCIYGLVFFIIIFILSVKALRKPKPIPPF